MKKFKKFKYEVVARKGFRKAKYRFTTKHTADKCALKLLNHQFSVKINAL